MATNDIGRVTPIWRGFYSAATTYELNDIVIDTAGSVWWHKSEELTTGVIPEAGEIWDAVIDMSVFSALIQAAITTAQTAVQAAQEAETGVAEDVRRAETAAQSAEASAEAASESAAGVGALAQAAEVAKNAAAGSAESAGSSATAAAGSKSDAEAYAVGKRGGTDVGVDDPTYHNNAKYYDDQAGSSAEAAAGSKSDAEAYAVGKRGGEDVGSEDPAYHNNAKYWSEQAEATAEDIENSSAQIAQNAADVADLKTQLGYINETFGISYVTGGYINVNGDHSANANYADTDFILCDKTSIIILNGIYVGASALAYAFYDINKEFISGQNSVSGDLVVTTIPDSAAYARFSSRISNGETPSVVVLNHKDVLKNIAGLNDNKEKNDFAVSALQDTVKNQLGGNINLFTKYEQGVVSNSTGELADNAKYIRTEDAVEINGESTLTLESIPELYGVGYVIFYSAITESGGTFISANEIASGKTKYKCTIPATAKYCRVTFGFANNTTPDDVNPLIIYLDAHSEEPYKVLERIEKINDNYPLNILVFGDSITDTINITIDAETNTTTAYSEKNPNNSYTKDGVTINFAMWPTLIQRVLNVTELRNYAKSGAHFYSTTNPPTDPRQKLLYQVQVALNDLDNPNGIFPSDNFVPDIVIVACGINEGNIANGAYETAMGKTVMNAQETGVDVEATMANLTQQNPIEAMRYVLMLLKQSFPTALFLYVNPLQQTYSTNEARLNAKNELGKMAEQYDFINLDGFGQFGVVRDFETQGAVGLLLKDGLHPNDKGQNLYARNIVQAIKRYYFPLNSFNP